MKVALLMVMMAALGLTGCASGPNAGAPGTEVQTQTEQGPPRSAVTNFDQWRYQGMTPTTPP